MTRPMPRLSTLSYVRQRAALREEWQLRNGYGFVVLSPTEQFYIHDYFEPAKNLSPLEAVAHRKDVTARRPSLPQQAGRAFARIRPFLNMQLDPKPIAPVAERSRTWGTGSRHVQVLSQVNPELDPKAFAQIIIELARQGPPPGMGRDDDAAV